MKKHGVTWTYCILLLLSVEVLHGYEILRHPRHTWVKENAQTELTCEFDEPIRSCFWKFNNNSVNIPAFGALYDLTVKDRLCTLKITKASLSRDEGQWRCYLKRVNLQKPGLTSEAAHLTVLVTPKPPAIFHKGLPTSQVRVQEGKKVTAECRTEGGSPATNFTWHIGNHVVKRKPRSTDWHQLTTSRDFVTWTATRETDRVVCYAHHGDNEFTTSLKLDVLYRTSSVQVVLPTTRHVTATVGDHVFFACAADGNPPPSFEWRMKTNSLSNWSTAASSANFSYKVTREDNGRTFACFAGNEEIKSLSSPVILKVKQVSVAAANYYVITGFVYIVVVIIATAGWTQYLKGKQKRARKIKSEEVKLAPTEIDA